jgi:hypothetical protein
MQRRKGEKEKRGKGEMGTARPRAIAAIPFPLCPFSTFRQAVER